MAVGFVNNLGKPAVTSVSAGGTGLSTATTAYAPVCAGTTATGNFQVASTGLSTAGWVLTSNGSSALPSFQSPGGGGTGAVAWVNFNANPTVAIRGSFGVTSLTDHGTGEYSVNFSSTLANSDYATVTSGCNLAGNNPCPIGVATRSTTAVRLIQWYMTATDGQGPVDGGENNVAVFI